MSSLLGDIKGEVEQKSLPLVFLECGPDSVLEVDWPLDDFREGESGDKLPGLLGLLGPLRACIEGDTITTGSVLPACMLLFDLSRVMPPLRGPPVGRGGGWFMLLRGTREQQNR